MSGVCAPAPTPTPGARRQSIGCEFGDAWPQLREEVRRKLIRHVSHMHVFILAIIHGTASQNVIVAEALDAANILAQFWKVIHCEVAVRQDCRQINPFILRNVSFHRLLDAWVDITYHWCEW